MVATIVRPDSASTLSFVTTASAIKESRPCFVDSRVRQQGAADKQAARGSSSSRT